MTEPQLTVKSAALALLIILAGLLTQLDLARRVSLHCEEAMYFHAANEPSLAESWNSSRSYTHPPLSFLLYHEWLKFGDSEWQLRLPSILLGAVATWITYLWIARLTNCHSALVGVFVLTCSLPMLQVTAAMRNYTLLFALVAGALWFDERFRESGRVRPLIGQVTCLAVALFSHYAAVWVIVVLGVVGVARSLKWGLGSRATWAWIASQFVLAGACVWLYVSHVREFVGSSTQSGMWEWWTLHNPYGESWGGWLTFTILSPCRFFGMVFGPVWIPMLVVAATGAVLILRVHRGERIERALLVGVPFVLALILQYGKIYPFGSTRHCLWLMPFVALLVSAATVPLFRRPSVLWRLGIVVAGLVWVGAYPYRALWTTAKSSTSELMRRTVAQLRTVVPRDELILVDDGTRYILAYYLGRGSSDHGHDIGQGFREYRLDGYRIVTIPALGFYQYSLRDNWSVFVSELGTESTQPLWWFHMELGQPEYKLKLIGRRLPPAKVLAQHTVGDNHLLRLQFREPQTTGVRLLETDLHSDAEAGGHRRAGVGQGAER